MSSESNENRPDAAEPAPSSSQARRSSARAPSAWGAVRDALAAVFNIEALLRSGVEWPVLRDLVPELRSGSNVLRSAFEIEAGADAAVAEIRRYGKLRQADLDALLDAIEPTAQREDLLQRAGLLADDLEATADLLALLDRAGEPAPTEVSLGLIASEARRLSGPSRGREVSILFDEASKDTALTTDPYVLGPLLSLVVACVHAESQGGVVLRAQSTPEFAFVVEAADASDEGLPRLAMRVMALVPPTKTAARRVAEKLGAKVEIEVGRATIALGPRRG
jgi:hypothetical protein